MSEPRFWLTNERLDPAAVAALIEDPGCGAVVTFVGNVRRDNEGRDVDYLEYEAYPGMAEAKMAEIGAEIEARWGLAQGRSSADHRGDHVGHGRPVRQVHRHARDAGALAKGGEQADVDPQLRCGARPRSRILRASSARPSSARSRYDE